MTIISNQLALTNLRNNLHEHLYNKVSRNITLKYVMHIKIPVNVITNKYE